MEWKAWAIGITFILVSIVPIPTISGGPSRDPIVNQTSLSGIHRISEMTTTEILGRSVPNHIESGGKIGEMVSFNDDDGDGHLDVIVVNEWGQTFLVSGDGSRFGEIIDLEGERPVMLNSVLPSGSEGDIDGNGVLDRIVGDPYSSGSKGVKEGGSLWIYFDHDTSNQTIKRIEGTDPYDNLGKSFALIDVDSDGMDDILVGVPGADGYEYDVGEVLLFKGRPNSSFPEKMDAETNAWARVLGRFGYYGPPDRDKGDRLGHEMDTADIDGILGEELILTLPFSRPDQMIYRSQCGFMMIFRPEDLFPAKGTHLLQDLLPLLQVEGEEIEDSFGWDIDVGDIDEDGFDDILVAVPGGDGIENSRSRCGEVYIIWGSGLNVIDVIVPTVVCAGSSSVEVEILFSDPSKSNVSGEMIIGGVRILIDSSVHSDDPEVVVGISICDNTGGLGSIRFDLYLGWYCPMKGYVDISLTLESGPLSTSIEFPKKVYIAKDIRILGPPVIDINGSDILDNGNWASPGDTMTLSGLAIGYVGYEGETDPCGLSLCFESNGTELGAIPYAEKWTFETVVRTGYYQVMIEFDAPPPAGMPYRFLPDPGDPYAIDLNLDINPPEAPSNVCSELVEVLPNICLEPAIGSGDHNESGVKYFIINHANGTEDIPRYPGGLWGTYYSDPLFETVAISQMDDMTGFDWGPWGPDPLLIPPFGYSVRWHGWLESDMEWVFRAMGSGEVRITVAGDEVLPWSDLEKEPRSRFFEEGEVVIFYRNMKGEGVLDLDLVDDRGWVYDIDPTTLLRPACNATISDDVTVVAVDWTGKVSEPSEVSIVKDIHPTMVDFGDVPTWLNTTKPTFHVRIEDRDGLDPSSIRYQLLDGEWTSDRVRFSSISETDATMIIDPTFPLDFRGMIELAVSDEMGFETVASSPWFGMDLRAPFVALLGVSGENVTVRVTDPGGSGVDLGSVGYSIDDGSWYGLSFDGFGTEVNFTHRVTVGVHEVTYRLHDLAGNWKTITFEVEIEIPVDNMPPVPVIRGPTNGTRKVVGRTLVLDSFGTSDDGLGGLSPVHMTWLSNISGYLGNDPILEVYLPEGHHRIFLFAFDGEYNKSVHVDVTIVRPVIADPDPEGSDMDDGDESIMLAIMFLLLSVILVAGISIMAFATHRKRIGVETRLNIDGREKHSNYS